MPKYLGISKKNIPDLRLKFGKNEIAQKEGPGWIEIFIEQFKSPMIYILLAVGFLSLVLNEYIDAGLIFLVLAVNVSMGFYQEFNAQKTLIALRKLVRPRAFVIRDGQREEIDAKELLPGDIVILGSGDKIPADGKLIEATSLLVNESLLTGEEEAILKNSKASYNLVYMGTTVLAGRGIMEVEKIGKSTEMGKISQSLSEIKETETPLQIKLNAFTKNLVWLILGVSAVIFIFGILHEENIWQMFKISIILSIAAIPEALPIAVTVILALGMREILKQNGLVKKLLSIETLGSTSIICTDKTGTLTEGKMQVVKVDTNDEGKILLAMTLVNEQKSSLEQALWDYVKKNSSTDPKKIFDSLPRIDEEPFDSEKKYALSINEVKNIKTAFLNGAPDIIVSFCDLSETQKNKISQKLNLWASEGLRLLASAYKIEGNLKEKKNFKWLGLVGIQDPIRSDVKKAIEIAKNSHIKVKIITGDFSRTAEIVARNLGFDLSDKNIMEGEELENISESVLKTKMDEIVVFARVSPHQKLKIVKCLQEQGEIVAMTGDGVNDAPALKKADIGVVVGSASEVAKEASDLILLDGDFKTIVAACEEGRLILANIKKVVGYVLSNAFAEIILIFGAMLLNFPAPLIVVQILWIHLICDGPPDILLGFEPKEKGLMEQDPKVIKKENILSRPMKFLIFIISITIGLSTLFLFWQIRNSTNDLNLARTVAFATVATASLVYIFTFKNLKKSLLKTENFFQNKALFVGVLYGFLLIAIAIYLPFFNRVLQTVPLKPIYWLYVITIAIITTFLIELVKKITQKPKYN